MILYGTAGVFCDNKSSITKFVLNKRNKVILYITGKERIIIQAFYVLDGYQGTLT